MARYIDADFVANGLREHLPPDDKDHKEVLDQMTYAISILQFAKEEEVAPVVHAYWKPSILPLIQIDWFRCSNCNANAIQTPFDIPAKTEFCPFCGAKMDGKEEG